MKNRTKTLLLSSVTAALVMTGCGGGSSSSSDSSTPSFATKEATIESTETVEEVVTSIDALDELDMGPTMASKTTQMKRTSLAEKMVASKIGKRPKTAFEKRRADTKAKLKSTMAATGCTEETYTEPYECSEGGSYTFTWTQAPGSNPGECITTYEDKATNCHDKDSYTDSYGTWTYDETYNGTYTGKDVEIIDGDGYWHWVEDTATMDYTSSGTYTDTPDGGTASTYSWNDKSKGTTMWEDDYTLTEGGVFTYLNTGSYKTVLSADMKYTSNDTPVFDASFSMDLAEKYDMSADNIYASTVDGYADFTSNLATDNNRFTFAADNLELTYDWSTSGVYKETIDGKIGSHCTGGLIAIDTNRTIVDNYSDAYELPNDGKLHLTGASNTTATLEFFQGTEGTYATATVGDETKTYHTAAEMQSEACQGEMLNPYYY